MAPASTTARMARPEPNFLVIKLGDRLDRAAVLHELSEQGPEQKQREELRKELGPANHENLGPVREKRLSRGRGRHERRSGRKQQNAPAPIGEPDQQSKGDDDAKKSHFSNRCPPDR